MMRRTAACYATSKRPVTHPTTAYTSARTRRLTAFASNRSCSDEPHASHTMPPPWALMLAVVACAGDPKEPEPSSTGAGGTAAGQSAGGSGASVSGVGGTATGAAGGSGPAPADPCEAYPDRSSCAGAASARARMGTGTEVRRLLAATESPKYRAIFTTAYGAGLRIGEVRHPESQPQRPFSTQAIVLAHPSGRTRLCKVPIAPCRPAAAPRFAQAGVATLRPSRASSHAGRYSLRELEGGGM